jgi:hypothetical protein
MGSGSIVLFQEAFPIGRNHAGCKKICLSKNTSGSCSLCLWCYVTLLGIRITLCHIRSFYLAMTASIKTHFPLFISLKPLANTSFNSDCLSTLQPLLPSPLFTKLWTGNTCCVNQKRQRLSTIFARQIHRNY